MDDKEREKIRDEIDKMTEEKDLELSTEFCQIAYAIVKKYNEFKENITKALDEYEKATSKAGKNRAFKLVEEIYIDNRIYLNKVRLPNSNFYFDNVCTKKYANKVKRAHNAMYKSLHQFQREMWDLRFNLEQVDTRLDRKVEKRLETLQPEPQTNEDDSYKMY